MNSETQNAAETLAAMNATPAKAKGSKKTGGNKAKEESFPVEPRVIQQIKKPRTIVNHSYRDFSIVPPVPGEEVPTDISQMSFPQKVHHILSQPEYQRFITWQPHGRAFRITIPKMFETKVCSKYMGHTRYSSFLRQLSNHSFKHITQGNDRNCYYHEMMLRGLPHLCKYMPKPKDARRLIPDPANEPDFYAISKAFPLPGDSGAEQQEPMSNTVIQAGTARLASDLAPSGNVPAAKRARIEPVEQQQAPAQAPVAQSTAFPQLPIASLQETQQLLQTLVNNASANNSVQAPAPAPVSLSLPTAQASLMSTMNAACPAPAQAPLQLPFGIPMANGNNGGTSNGSVLSALRSAQMQAAQDRNSALLATLRENLQAQNQPQNNQASLSQFQQPQQPVAASNNNTTDIASALAAALIQQFNRNGPGANNQAKNDAVNNFRNLLGNSL